MLKNRALFFAVFTVGLVACSKDSNQTIAKAGSIRVTSKDLAAEIENTPEAYKTYLSTLEGKKQFLDILLRERILLNAAERSGIVRNKEIQQNLKDYRERMKEQETEYRKGLLLREYLRQLRDKDLKVDDAEVQQYYDERRADYQNPVRVTPAHILTQTEEEAKAALKRLKAGEDFAKVAKEISTDPSAENGGKIPEVMKGDLSDIPEFEAALFKLKPGQVSGVVKTKIGYHIIKKIGEMKLPEQSFEQAGPQIRRVLEKKKFDEWVEKAKKEQKVWIDDKALAELPVSRGEHGVPGEGMTNQ
jgi:peptidyl-prolyl cis-trans isomerase C